MRKTKLWGGLVHCDHRIFGDGCKDRQHRCLVQATSQKRAVELLNEHIPGSMSVSHLRNYWAETGNDIEVALGESVEGEALWAVKGQRYNIRTPEQYTRLA